MFTGLVEALGRVESSGRAGAGHRVALGVPEEWSGEVRTGDSIATGGFRWLGLAESAAIEMWDYETWSQLAAREVRLVREAGALTALPLALNANGVSRIFAGDLAAAAALGDEVDIASEATASHLLPFIPLQLAAWQGRE